MKGSGMGERGKRERGAGEARGGWGGEAVWSSLRLHPLANPPHHIGPVRKDGSVRRLIEDRGGRQHLIRLHDTAQLCLAKVLIWNDLRMTWEGIAATWGAARCQQKSCGGEEG